jgi:hypothetical protein
VLLSGSKQARGWDFDQTAIATFRIILTEPFLLLLVSALYYSDVMKQIPKIKFLPYYFSGVSGISDSFFSQPVYKFWKAFSSLLTGINDSIFIWIFCLKPLKIQTSSESGNNCHISHSSVLFDDVFRFSYTASVMYGWTNEVWLEAYVDWYWFGKTGVLGGKTVPMVFDLPHPTRTGLGLNAGLRRERRANNKEPKA